MEIIKEIINSEEVNPGCGFDILVRCVIDKDGVKSKNTLVKKTFNIYEGKKNYQRHKGLNLSDLTIVKKNWSKILKAMMK